MSVKALVIESISENSTVEQITAVAGSKGVSSEAVSVVLTNLIKSGEVVVNNGLHTYVGAPQVAPAPQNKKQLNLTPEQENFRKLVQAKRGDIYDANKVLIHRGAQVLFAGCGPQAFRYKIAVSGFSDKEPVEYPVMYLDWDDSALYDEGGIRDQIQAIVGKPEPVIAPTIVAQPVVQTPQQPVVQPGVQGAK